jgi:hypothetical protein
MRRAVATVVACVALSGLLGAGCGSSGPSGSSAADAYCSRIARIGALDLLSDPAPTAVRRDLAELLHLTRRAAAVAPDGIRADARAAARAQVRFNAVYAAHGWDRHATLTDPAFLALSSDRHLAAIYTRLERYQIKTCHDDDGGEPPTVAPA